MKVWSVYMIRTRLGTLYTGSTMDVARRFAEHGQAGGRGSKYLRSKGPLCLAYEVEIGDSTLAFKVEHRIKSLRKPEKEAIICAKLTSSELLALLGLAAPEDTAPAGC